MYTLLFFLFKIQIKIYGIAPSRDDYPRGHRSKTYDKGRKIYYLLLATYYLLLTTYSPQFVDLTAGNVQMQMLILGAIFMMLGILAYFPLAYFSGIIGTWIQTRKAIADKLHLITGSIFIGLGIRIALPAKSS